MIYSEFQLDYTNLEMCEWAYRYLGRQANFPPNPTANKYQQCKLFLNSLSESSRILMQVKMSAAWRQKLQRDKQKASGRKPCTFFLKRKSLEDLERLANEIGCTINETLEVIIQRTYIENKAQIAQQKLAMKNRKNI